MFYSQFLGLTLVAPLDVPGASVQRALVAADLEPSSFGLELLSGGPAMSAMVGDWSGFLVLTVPDRAQCLQSIAASGQGTVVSEEAAVIPVRNPSPEGGRTLQVRRDVRTGAGIVCVVSDVATHLVFSTTLAGYRQCGAGCEWLPLEPSPDGLPPWTPDPRAHHCGRHHGAGCRARHLLVCAGAGHAASPAVHESVRCAVWVVKAAGVLEPRVLDRGVRKMVYLFGNYKTTLSACTCTIWHLNSATSLHPQGI